MHSEYYIAKRLHFSQSKHQKMSRPAVHLAVAGMAVGIAVMILTVCVVIGFKQEVRNKVVGFGAHVQITNFDNNNTYEMHSLTMSKNLFSKLKALPNVESVQVFATKPGIIKTSTAFQGIVLKGVSKDYDWSFFSNYLVDGAIPQSNDEMLLSQLQSDQLQLQVGDTFFCYFIGDQVRARRYIVSGIYESGFHEFDKLFVVGDILQVQQLNGWSQQQYSGIEIRIKEFNLLEDTFDEVYSLVANRFDEEENAYYVQSIDQLQPAVFSWLELLNMNVVVIIFLMLCVSGFTIISGLLILILDNIHVIGIFKALGASNQFIRKIFLWQSTWLIGKGLVIGNIVALLLCLIQYTCHIIPLDPSAYYVSFVPISFNWSYWLALNIGVASVSILILIAPSYLITKISAAQVLRYE